MKTSLLALRDLLYGQNVHAVADLYTFYFSSGTVRWTSAAADVTYSATTWSATAPVLNRGQIKAAAGLQVDTLEIRLSPGPMTLAGVPMLQAALAGSFDGARVLVQRAYGATPGTVEGLATEFDGTIVDVEPASTEMVLTVKSAVAKMAEALPRRTFQPGCPYQVYDARCGLVSTSFKDDRTATSSSTAAIVWISASSARVKAGGWITFTSGALNGVTRGIRVDVAPASPMAIVLDVPLPSAPAAGDGVRIFSGCDKTRLTCNGTFSNLARFGGFPDLPRPEAVR